MGTRCPAADTVQVCWPHDHKTHSSRSHVLRRNLTSSDTARLPTQYQVAEAPVHITAPDHCASLQRPAAIVIVDAIARSGQSHYAKQLRWRICRLANKGVSHHLISFGRTSTFSSSPQSAKQPLHCAMCSGGAGLCTRCSSCRGAGAINFRCHAATSPGKTTRAPGPSIANATCNNCMIHILSESAKLH
jgi:hypothetical protein